MYVHAYSYREAVLLTLLLIFLNSLRETKLFLSFVVQCLLLSYLMHLLIDVLTFVNVITYFACIAFAEPH